MVENSRMIINEIAKIEHKLSKEKKKERCNKRYTVYFLQKI